MRPINQTAYTPDFDLSKFDVYFVRHANIQEDIAWHAVERKNKKWLCEAFVVTRWDDGYMPNRGHAGKNGGTLLSNMQFHYGIVSGKLDDPRTERAHAEYATRGGVCVWYYVPKAA